MRTTNFVLAITSFKYPVSVPDLNTHAATLPPRDQDWQGDDILFRLARTRIHVGGPIRSD